MTEDMPEVRYVGIPDGPKQFVAEFGLEVDTFTQEPGGKQPALSWHVPLNLRGTFRPDQLANYDSDKAYRIDKYGFAMCVAKVKAEGDAEPKLCRRKAVNRFPRCVVHGGRLHPLDRLQQDTGEPETEVPLSRYQMFLAKQITVDDLDDEEITCFGFRDARGRIFKPKNIPRELVTQFTRAIFDRSLDKLKTSSLEAARTLETLMLDPSVDASVRVKCAIEILDRTVGKAPLLVTLNAQAPWETIFEAIAAKPLDILDVQEVPDLETPSLPPDLQLPES